jgi:MarR family transcriptional regulator, organic hydroperoxide resistance regulator
MLVSRNRLATGLRDVQQYGKPHAEDVDVWRHARAARSCPSMTKNPSERVTYPLGTSLEFLQCLWRLNQALEKLSSRMEKRLGITAQQRFVIRCVGKYPGMTAGQLAAVLHVDPGTVSAALKRLEDKELLERRRDPHDRRRVTLGLSAHGRALARPSAGTVEHAVDQLVASLKPRELDAIQGLLARLTTHLDAE